MDTEEIIGRQVLVVVSEWQTPAIVLEEQTARLETALQQTTRQIADALGVDAQTVRRAGKALGILPRKQGKSFVYSMEQTSLISDRLKSVPASSIASNRISDASNEAKGSGSDAIEGRKTLHLEAEVADDASSLQIEKSEYVELIQRSARFDALESLLEAEKERCAELKGENEALRAQIETLRVELDSAKEELYRTKYRRLTLLERLSGRLALPKPKETE